MRSIPFGYNVQFSSPSTIETYQMMASDFFAQRLSVDDWTSRILFPEDHHAIHLPVRELGKAKFNLKWVDPELNYEQQVRPLFIFIKESNRRHYFKLLW